ncbi:hypothetical protein [Candidatus Hodgkinia cicadicola]|uniref:hypothetical protein n=1 Tax=Candidatus Hodgkinia cicadicola TaxID=573658 RepID=UPI0011BA9A69
MVYNTGTKVVPKRSDYNRITTYVQVVKSDIIDIKKSNCFKKRKVYSEEFERCPNSNCMWIANPIDGINSICSFEHQRGGISWFDKRWMILFLNTIDHPVSNKKLTTIDG